MPWALHPALAHLLGLRNAGSVLRDVFGKERPGSTCSPGNAVSHRLPFQIIMIKIAVARHVPAVVAGRLLKLRMQPQEAQTTKSPETVDFGENSLFAA